MIKKFVQILHSFIYFLKKTQELENELKKLYDEETEKKENEIRLAKEKNLRFESYDKQVT